MAGQPARFSTADSFFRTAAGSRGESSFFGDGNIQWELTLCRYCARISKTGGGQENAPTGGTGLGLGDRQLPLDALNLPLYSQGASPEIQIIPPEGQDLAPAQAGSQLQQEQFEAAVLLGLDRQTLDLLSRQHLHLFGACDRRFAGESGIFQDQPLGHRLIQCHPAGHMTALYHAVGQAGAVLIHRQEPTSILQPVIELLEVRRSQLGQGDGPQLRDDVLVDAVFIVRLGLGTNVRLALPLIPAVQPGPKGHVCVRLSLFRFTRPLKAGLQCIQLCAAL